MSGPPTENDIDTRGRGISARNQKCLETYWGNSRAATNIGQRPGEFAADSPAVPPSEILSEPPHPQGGRLLLIKPESFAGAVGQRLGCQAQPCRGEMLAQEIEAPLYPAPGGLVRVFGQLQVA